MIKAANFAGSKQQKFGVYHHLSKYDHGWRMLPVEWISLLQPVYLVVARLRSRDPTLSDLGSPGASWRTWRGLLPSCELP